MGGGVSDSTFKAFMHYNKLVLQRSLNGSISQGQPNQELETHVHMYHEKILK